MHARPELLEAEGSGAAVPDHGEVRQPDPRREVPEDELEVAGRPQGQDTWRDEVLPLLSLVEAP
eukprot:631996-Alexandrium_andersonii.AAC.1